MKQVIYLWNYTESGGAQIYFLSIIKNAPKDRRFTVVLPRDSKPGIIDFFEQFGVEFDFLEPHLEMKARTIYEKVARQWRRITSEIAVYGRLLKYDLKKSVVCIEAASRQSWILLYFLSAYINAIPEAVIDLKTGLLIEAGNARRLSEATLKLYADEKLRNDPARNGREYVLENFDERIAGRIAPENYEKCLAN